MLSICPVHIFVSSVLIIQRFCSLFVFAKTSLPLFTLCLVSCLYSFNRVSPLHHKVYQCLCSQSVQAAS